MERVEIELHAFFTYKANVDEWSASHPEGGGGFGNCGLLLVVAFLLPYSCTDFKICTCM